MIFVCYIYTPIYVQIFIYNYIFVYTSDCIYLYIYQTAQMGAIHRFVNVTCERKYEYFLKIDFHSLLQYNLCPFYKHDFSFPQNIM
jgi:hypothetical protein